MEALQRLLDVRADGEFGRRTEAALRARQLAHGLKADGICGPRTWARLLDALAAFPVETDADGLGLSPAGVALIHEFEGCARKGGDGLFRAYRDPGSKTGKPWTIGWGSTGDGIGEGTVWTRRQCDDHFNERIGRYVADVRRALRGAPTTQNQFDALVSFHYNTGKIAKATLTALHREGRYAEAADEFGKWVRNDGKPMLGLVRRRQMEADLYMADAT